MSVERRIRWNFGKQPSEVIKEYRDLGFGKKATAEIIHIDRQTLNKLSNRFGIEFLPYKQLNEFCKAPGRKAL